MRGTWISALLFVLLVCPAQAQFGGLGKIKGAIDKAGNKAQKIKGLQVSEEEELTLGKAVSQKIREKFGVQQDSDPTRYVTLVGSVVAEKGSRPALPYTFIILDTSAVNAFAAPGGFIHITRGALASMKNEAELAGVLGHEIAHITQKHSINAIQTMNVTEFGQGEVNLTSNPRLLNMAVDKIVDLLLRGYSQSQELESDAVGLRLAFKAGYDPAGLIAFLETLKAQSEGDTARSGRLASHPEAQERVDKLNAQISTEKLYSQASVLLPERYKRFIKYEAKSTDIAAGLEGAKGLAGSDEKKKNDKSAEKKDQENQEEPKKSRFSLSKLKNPTASSEKKQTAQVTGSGASRGVGNEGAGAEDPNKPKNPNALSVTVSKDDVKKFKESGKLPD
ncbi:MAG TPA: M48 family metalloprotease [Acidobacteriota bacterium]|jgi:predicted Zn-dependent protease